MRRHGTVKDLLGATIKEQQTTTSIFKTTCRHDTKPSFIKKKLSSGNSTETSSERSSGPIHLSHLQDLGVVEGKNKARPDSALRRLSSRKLVAPAIGSMINQAGSRNGGLFMSCRTLNDLLDTNKPSGPEIAAQSRRKSSHGRPMRFIQRLLQPAADHHEPKYVRPS